MINASEFLKHLIAIGSKLSTIARFIRIDSSLFDLLIEEKHETIFLKNDYKTFADVLIQETLRHDLEKLQFGLSEHLFGEENNEFTNKLDVKIKIRIGDDESETRKLILQVLDGNDQLASTLVSVIHRSATEFIDKSLCLDRLLNVNIPISDLGLWIDPIDATAEYIRGVGLNDPRLTEPQNSSIKNATVLIGAFSLETGLPFVGVVYQPFSHQDGEKKWTHSCYWGIKTNDISLYSNDIKTRHFTSPAYAVTSEREINVFSNQLNRTDLPLKWSVTNRSGAGFKFLRMLQGEFDCYILSKASTYKWDTCGPHAILMAVGGGVVNYQKILHDLRTNAPILRSGDERDQLICSLLAKYQLRYLKVGDDDGNNDGFLAYPNIEVAMTVINTLLEDA